MRFAVSRSKADFLQALGLSNDDPGHRNVYASMKREAMSGRARLCEDRNSLVPQCINDASVQPPYSSSQIAETAMHREVLRIFSLASSTTRPYYQLGQFQDGSNQDNWVIRWMLWNVFRYGMNRRNARSDSPDQMDSPEASTAAGSASSTAAQGQSSDPSRRAVPYDPIRDQ